MRLLINTAHQRFGGAVQVALSFIQECRNHPEHDYIVWVGPGLAPSLQNESFPANFHFRTFDFGPITLGSSFTINRTLRRLEREVHPDCIFSSTGPTYFHSRAPQVIGFNLPLYLYPESPYFTLPQPLRRRVERRFRRPLHLHYYRRDADALVVQTADVGQRVQRLLPGIPVHVVSNTHSSAYLRATTGAQRLPERESGRQRLLTLSAWYPHKHLEIIPHVLQALQRRGADTIDFVLTLPQDKYESLIPLAWRNRVFNTGPVKPADGPDLYRECDVMFLPTLLECFSASYPEAMVTGRPIVTSDLGFARGICGDAALYFKPADPESAADTIITLFNDTILREKLVNAGRERLKTFDDAPTRARKYLTICEELCRR